MLRLENLDRSGAMESDFPEPQDLRSGPQLRNNSLVIASTLKFHIDVMRDHMFSFIPPFKTPLGVW